MDEPLDNPGSADADLEDQLLATPLRRPSELLAARVRQTIRRHEARARQRRRLAWGLAAMFVVGSSIVLTFHQGRHDPQGTPGTAIGRIGKVAGPSSRPESRPPIALSAPGAASRPVRVVRTLSTVADDGVVGTIDGCPIQRVRQLQVDQVVVFDPTRGCSVVYRRPRERVVFVAARAF